MPDIEAAAEERERVAEAKRETERRRVGIHSHLLEAQQTAARRREELEEAKRSDAANRQRMHLDLMQAHQDAAERKQQEQIAQELHSTRQNTVLEQIRTQWLLRASETKSSINVRKMKAERRQEMAESLSTPQPIQPSSVSAPSSSSSDPPPSCGLTRGESFREKRQVFEQPIVDPSSPNSPSSSSNSPSSSVLNPEHVRPVGQAARRLPTNRRTQQPQPPRTVGVAEQEKKNASSMLEAAIREGKERQLEESRAEDARRKEMAAVASAMPLSLISDLTGKLCAANNSPNLHRSTGEKGEAHRPRVIRCVGKPRVFAVEVQVSWSSLSPWSTYLFDSSPQTIFVWSGPRSSRLEQAKGMALAIIIRDHERAAKASIVKLDRFSSAEELAPFWQALECNAAQQQEAIDEQLRPEDEAVSSASAFFNGLFRLFQLSVQEPRFSEIPHPRGLMMAMLQPAHSYLLDAGTELYLWQGANSSLSLPAASDLASAFQNQRSPALPSWVRLRKVSDGGEPFLFREKFADWPDLSHSEVLKRRMHRASPLQQRSPVAGTAPAVRFDGKQLAEEVDVAAAAPFLEEERTHPPPSNGNGEVANVWKVLGKGLKAEVLASLYGIFDSQSSYIIVYKYLVGLADRYTVFLWQGRSASRLISGSGSISMTQVYDELRQVHFVSQEVIHDCDYHLHFSSIFKHRYVVFRTPFQESPASPRLLHVRASPNHLRHDPAFIPSSAFALETDPSAASLSTNDAFILIASGTINVWIGNACHPALREAAVAIASRLPQALSSTSLSGPNVFSENQTPLSFWTPLGGRDLYTASQPAQGFPALFAFSGHTRTFRPHLVRNFSQNDLQPDKALFLHSGPDLFLWHGAQTPISDTRAAVAIVQEYADACRARAGGHLTVTQIHDGSEPVAFTRHFHGWNATKSRSPSRVQPLLISRSVDASPPQRVSSSRHSAAVVSSPPTSAAAAEHTCRDPLAALRARKALTSSSSPVSSTPSPVVATTDPLAALRARKAVAAPGDATPAPVVAPTVVVTSQSADPPKVS
ncbi:MAG: hypothetical protein Q8P67_16045, partial [archaeon]|nr:hypothetical protein [archaeon]